MLPLDQCREIDGMTCVHAVVLVPHVPLAVLLLVWGRHSTAMHEKKGLILRHEVNHILGIKKHMSNIYLDLSGNQEIGDRCGLDFI